MIVSELMTKLASANPDALVLRDDAEGNFYHFPTYIRISTNGGLVIIGHELDASADSHGIDSWQLSQQMGEPI